MKSEILIFGNSDKLRAIAGVGKWRERPHPVSSARLPPNPVPLLSFTLFVSISQTSVWFCCGRFFSLQPNGSFPKYLVKSFFFFLVLLQDDKVVAFQDINPSAFRFAKIIFSGFFLKLHDNVIHRF
jgi:hypothetical protein